MIDLVGFEKALSDRGYDGSIKKHRQIILRYLETGRQTTERDINLYVGTLTVQEKTRESYHRVLMRWLQYITFGRVTDKKPGTPDPIEKEKPKPQVRKTVGYDYLYGHEASYIDAGGAVWR